MARARDSQPLVASVLDRLLDEGSVARPGRAASSGQLLNQLRESVRRDLENLLNTRQWHVVRPSNLSELDTSLVDYGIPDFAGTNLSGDNRERFRGLVEDAIRRYETRFRDVRVDILDNAAVDDRTLRLRISATMNVEHSKEPLQFDTLLEPAHGSFEVKKSS